MVGLDTLKRTWVCRSPKTDGVKLSPFSFREELSKKEHDMDLEQFDKAYKNTNNEPFDIPDGVYEMKVLELVLKEKNDQLRLRWRLSVEDTEQAGKIVFKTMPIKENTLFLIKKDLEKCGVELDAFSQLSKKTDDANGAVLRVVKKTVQSNGKKYPRYEFAETLPSF